MAVLARLLAAGHEVHCLVRAADDAEADSRLRAVLARVQAPSSGRAVADRRRPHRAPAWGSASATTSSPRGVGSVIHSAASVAFDLPLEEARAINVEGTRRVLDFAGAVPGLQRVTYVSTAYVAGDRRGTAYEDDRETGAFRNSYERSKHEAEALVRSSTLPWTIARPSIVVGESTTGWTASFNVLYGPLRAFDAGAYPVLPARRRSPVDVVSVDYVADAVAALAHHPEAAGGTFHLTAGAHDVERGGDHEAGDGPLRSPRRRAWSRRAPTGGCCIRSSCARAAPSTRRMLERSEVYFPYFAMRLRFDDARRVRCSSRWGSRRRPWATTSGGSSSSPAPRAGASARWTAPRPSSWRGRPSDVRTPALRPSLGAAAMPA